MNDTDEISQSQKRQPRGKTAAPALEACLVRYLIIIQMIVILMKAIAFLKHTTAIQYFILFQIPDSVQL